MYLTHTFHEVLDQNTVCALKQVDMFTLLICMICMIFMKVRLNCLTETDEREQIYLPARVTGAPTHLIGQR